MLPTIYFLIDNDKARNISERCANYGYNVTYEHDKGDLKRANTFFYVTHDLNVFTSYEEIYDTRNFICVILYHFIIDDKKDTNVLESFFREFLRGNNFFSFPKSAGLLRHFVDPKLKI